MSAMTRWRPIPRRKAGTGPSGTPLDSAAAHGHQAILRFYDTYPGKATTVPAYIKSLPGYHETRALCEGEKTHFPDWSHPALQSFILEFFKRFALRYDDDPRLAFLQVGFGLWADTIFTIRARSLGSIFLPRPSRPGSSGNWIPGSGRCAGTFRSTPPTRPTPLSPTCRN